VERLNNLYGADTVAVMPDNSSSIPFGGISIQELNLNYTPFSLYVFIHWNHKIVEDTCKIDFKIIRDFQVLGMGGYCDGKSILK
jgi:hypothetical protein